jgi:hypothetical protein
MPRLDREILSNIFCLLWRGLMGSGPRRPRISVRTDGSSMEQAVGPAKSIVAESATRRIRTAPRGSGRSSPVCTLNLPNSPRWTWPTSPVDQW